MLKIKRVCQCLLVTFEKRRRHNTFIMSFVNKVVLVTGASSGIGAAVAVKFAGEGAKVAIVGRNESKLRAVSELCEKAGSKPLLIIADVSKDDDVRRIVGDTVKFFQKLDILINNAGTFNTVSILSEDAMQMFDQTMATNLRSCVYLTHLAGKHLVESKGNIINISSIVALRIFSRESFCYATSKAALDHFTRAVASELAPKGVRVNSINPGPVKTDVYENMGVSKDDEASKWELLKQFTALHRISEPEEIADLALFLASDKAVAITGASFVSDNGVLVQTSF